MAFALIKLFKALKFRRYSELGEKTFKTKRKKIGLDLFIQYCFYERIGPTKVFGDVNLPILKIDLVCKKKPTVTIKCS